MSLPSHTGLYRNESDTSDSSSGSESDAVDNESDTSDSSSDEHRTPYVTEATWSSPEEFVQGLCLCY